jgi:tetratricopeptide (TPR) repeat protein
MKNTRSLEALSVLFCALALEACAARAGGSASSAVNAQGEVRPVDVSPAAFATEVAFVLGERKGDATREGRLVSAVRFELGRAGQLFDAGHEDAGLDSIEGAFYLVRAGEFHPAMVQGRTGALLFAANAVARQGKEGRALALYAMLENALPAGATKNEVSAHVGAIKSWSDKTRSKGPLQAAGMDERNAVDRALWDPSPEARDAARAATVEWIDRAIGYSKEQSPPSDDFERDEAIEAYRAIRTGAMVLSALYLRNGAPAAAVDALEAPQVTRVVSPRLRDALRRASDDDDAEAWLELFATFDRLGATDSVVALDPDLAQAAAWGAAVELYRAEPKTMRGVMPIATMLLRRRLSEVTPLLVGPVVEKAGQAEVSSWFVGYVLEALMSHDAVSDVDAARRTYERASPVLEKIEKAAYAKDVSPSVARVRYTMGAIEARNGDLARARTLVAGTTKTEPSLRAFELLAAIDRQRGDSVEALKSLETVAKMATEVSDATAVADARLLVYEVQRDRGDAKEAAKAIDLALRRALDARQLARTSPEQASAERVLARILEQYGSLDGARRATGRAYDASKTDLRQLTATVLEAARRGLTRNDLRSSRDAARRAIDGNVLADDLVYVALWLRLLERHLGLPSDGTVEEAFAKIDDDDGWPARLRSWSTGRLTDAQLYASAKTRVEQAEASFYAAMSAYAANDARAKERIASIAKSDAIELVEVAIARDLSAESKHIDLKLPTDIQIP